MYGKYNEDVRKHDSPACQLLTELLDRIKKIEDEKNALSLKNLAVNGKDLIEIGIPAGKELGSILTELFETVLEDPAQNQKETLLNIAKKIYENRNL